MDPRGRLGAIRSAAASRSGTLRAAVSPGGFRAAAVELVWISAHVVMYPIGLLEERAREGADRYSIDDLPPSHRGLMVGDVEAAGTPILLIHGVVDNRSIFTVMRRGLRRRGFGRIYTLNYSPLTDDVRDVAGRLAETIEAICADTGYERIHLIGHSMGGLIARQYVQKMGGDARVHTCVTLGTPHGGTYPARLVPHPVARQLRPGSELLTELAAPAPGCRTRFLAFWSDLDQLMIPKASAQLHHPDLLARNVFVRGVGHLSLPIDGRVVREIAVTLAHLDHDGTTLSAGISTLRASGTAGA